MFSYGGVDEPKHTNPDDIPTGTVFWGQVSSYQGVFIRTAKGCVLLTGSEPLVWDFKPSRVLHYRKLNNPKIVEG